MELYEGIISRRSVRKFRNKEISQDIIDALLKAAMYAPSGKDQRPWEFVVIRDKETLQEISERQPNAHMTAHADLGILVCAAMSREQSPGNWPLDCAATTQNILLAAHSKGLGSCWCGVYPKEDRMAVYKEICELPDGVIPFSFVVLGYPVDEPKVAGRFESERIHLEKWSE